MNLKDEFTQDIIELAEKIYNELNIQMTPLVKKYSDFGGHAIPWGYRNSQQKASFCLVARWHMAHKEEKRK